jgi:AraC-like DNA-binding protein
MQPIVASYREFVPCEALKQYVRAIFSYVPGTAANPTHRKVACEILGFVGDSFCPPMFADGHASLALNLGTICRGDGHWERDPAGCRGKVTGAVTRVNSVGVERAEMIGVYFHAGQLASFIAVPGHEFTNRIVDLEDVWGSTASALPVRLAEMSESARIDELESLLIRRIGNRTGSNSAVNVRGLAASVQESCGQVTVEEMASQSGVSRQHLTRLFRESVGITPKVYCRLARFQSGLVYAGSGEAVDWAQAALDLGYADQSHMIAEFREFSSLTPQMLAARRWLHPFIERAKHLRNRCHSPSAGRNP